MPRERRPLSPAERDIVYRYFSYDARQDAVVWAARSAADFSATDPEYMANGWNQRNVGQPVSISGHGQVAFRSHGKRYSFTETTVRELFGAPPNRYPVRRPQAERMSTREPKLPGVARENFTNAEVLRQVFYKTPDGKLRWAKRRQDLQDRLRDIIAITPPDTGRNPPQFGAQGLKIFNARMGGKEVRRNADRVVRVCSMLRVSEDTLKLIFGADTIIGAAAGWHDVEPLPDNILREVCMLDPADKNRVLLRPRSAGTWDRLREVGAAGDLTEQQKAEWNAAHAGRPAPMSAARTSAVVVILGRRRVGLKRVKDVLSAAPTHIF